MHSFTNQKNISVVVPVFNEEKHIQRVLESLLQEKNHYSIIDEIIVVDNYSTDKSFEIIQVFDGITAFQSVGNVSHIRNVGAKYCKSEILAFIDGDCVIQPGWSQSVLSLVNCEQKSWPNIVFGSAVKVPTPSTWIESVWFKPIAENSLASNHINSGNLLMPLTLFHELGGFNANMNSTEDVDICQRAKTKGAKLIEDTAISAIHLGFPKTIKDFWYREYWHGQGMLVSKTRKLENKALLLSLFTTVVLLTLLASLYKPFVILVMMSIYVAILVMLSIHVCNATSPGKILKAVPLLLTYSFARTVSLWHVLLSKGVSCIRL